MQQSVSAAKVNKGYKRIEEAYNNREVLKATVVQVLEGGLSVIVEEVRVFIPASLVSDTYEKDLTKYVYSFFVRMPSDLYPIFNTISSVFTSMTVPSTTSPECIVLIVSQQKLT